MNKLETADSPRRSQVVVNYGRHLLIEDDDGSLLRAVTRGRKIKPVCGDHVYWQPQQNGQAVIEAIVDRKSVLQRHDVRAGSRILAANVDILFVVMAAKPAPDLELIDRYLVAGEALGLDVQLIYNKSDLLDEQQKDHWRQVLQDYCQLGYPLHWTDAKQSLGLNEVRAALASHCGILVGPSGAGKSTLIRALVPDHEPRTQALSQASGQGQHTTTATRLYRLPADNGGTIIDSPGVRDFRLWHLTASELASCYREFQPLLDQCRFANCRHLKEPGCAIKEAVASKVISERRYAGFTQLSAWLEEQPVN